MLGVRPTRGCQMRMTCCRQADQARLALSGSAETAFLPLQHPSPGEAPGARAREAERAEGARAQPAAPAASAAERARADGAEPGAHELFGSSNKHEINSPQKPRRRSRSTARTAQHSERRACTPRPSPREAQAQELVVLGDDVGGGLGEVEGDGALGGAQVLAPKHAVLAAWVGSGRGERASRSGRAAGVRMRGGKAPTGFGRERGAQPQRCAGRAAAALAGGPSTGEQQGAGGRGRTGCRCCASRQTTQPRPGYTRPYLWPLVLMDATFLRRKSLPGTRAGRRFGWA